MRFLGIGQYNSLADMYWRLGEEGHEVRVYVQESEAHEIYGGLLHRVDSWESQLDWIRAAGAEGIIVFESASMGEEADRLRRDGFQVVGGSAWGDRLECDRAFGQQVMRDADMQTAPTHAFTDYDAAIAFLRSRPGRYVYKLSDATSVSTRNYVGEMSDGRDLIAMLETERDAFGVGGMKPQFVLMEHVTGVEVGIGAYFNGETFLEPACIDWEHKRFFPGDLGELTGEMGTVVSYRGSRRLFEMTLAKIAPGLRTAGHCGYLNINTIVNEHGVWPLEFTCRFGYPGFAICDALHKEGWASILRKMVSRSFRFIETTDGFAVGVVVTVPPFPYEYGYGELSKGAPIFFRTEPSAAERSHLHYAEVEIRNGQLIASGSLGYIMVVTGVGTNIHAAQKAAYARVDNVVVQNMRYRTDIGDKLAAHDLAEMRRLQLLG
jgi:phosphoribosylamine---glycine ligase